VSVSCLLSDYELQRYGVLDSRKPSGDLQTRDKRRGSHKDRSAIGNGRNLWSKSENRGSRPGHGGPIAYKRPWSWTRNCRHGPQSCRRTHLDMGFPVRVQWPRPSVICWLFVRLLASFGPARLSSRVPALRRKWRVQSRELRRPGLL